MPSARADRTTGWPARYSVRFRARLLFPCDGSNARSTVRAPRSGAASGGRSRIGVGGAKANGRGVSRLEDLVLLLVMPRPEQGEAGIAAWLQAASRNLDGYRPQPSVIRRSRNERGMQVEARRWTAEPFLPLSPGWQPRDTLMLAPDGRLVLCRLDGERHLRRKPNDTIVDEIYALHPLAAPTVEQLRIVRERALAGLYPLGYEHWSQLPAEQRRELVRFGGSWQDASAALADVDGPERVEALQLFLGPEAAPKLRADVQEAGFQGHLRPGTDVLAWLLAQPDWNLQPGLVTMARTAVQDEPAKAWELNAHPNPQVRLRLADLFEGDSDWLGWLAKETDGQVRDRILRALERHHSPAELVEQLQREKDNVRREALGWALVHWSRGITRKQDWAALNRALFTSMGRENRARLKDKLKSQGRLGLRARLLG